MTPVQEMFQAICDVFAWKPDALTKSARTRIGKVSRELREVGATPEMVRFARQVLDERFGDAVYGPEAIALWWGEVERRWNKRPRPHTARPRPKPVDEERDKAMSIEENRRFWAAWSEAQGELSERLSAAVKTLDA